MIQIYDYIYLHRVIRILDISMFNYIILKQIDLLKTLNVTNHMIWRFNANSITRSWLDINITYLLDNGYIYKGDKDYIYITQKGCDIISYVDNRLSKRDKINRKLEYNMYIKDKKAPDLNK